MKTANSVGLGFIVMFFTALALSLASVYSSFYTDGNGVFCWSIILGIGAGLVSYRK